MWGKIKLFWKINSPEIMRLFKAILRFSFNVIFPLALEAVGNAEKQFPGSGYGKEKFEFATDYVKAQAPEAAAKAVLSAVQAAWMTKEAEGWK